MDNIVVQVAGGDQVMDNCADVISVTCGDLAGVFTPSQTPPDDLLSGKGPQFATVTGVHEDNNGGNDEAVGEKLDSDATPAVSVTTHTPPDDMQGGQNDPSHPLPSHSSCETGPSQLGKHMTKKKIKSRWRKKRRRISSTKDNPGRSPLSWRSLCSNIGP
jgi:hypothetical protein